MFCKKKERKSTLFHLFIGCPDNLHSAILSGFQVVPHITDAIKNWIESVSLIPVDGKEGPADVCVIELGGTVGKNFGKL